MRILLLIWLLAGVLGPPQAAPPLDVLPASGAAQLARSLDAAAVHSRHILRDTAPVNDDETVDIFASGRKMRVSVHPDLDSGLKRGQEVVLNESLNVVMARGFDSMGEVVTIKEGLEDGHRALIVGRADRAGAGGGVRRAARPPA